eukprot:15342173-Ditylum_brightwellii.AAC.1
MMQKAVRNTILHSGIANGVYGMWSLFFDSRFTVSHLLKIMRMEFNLLAAAICRSNRKGFSSDLLNLDKDAECRDFI